MKKQNMMVAALALLPFTLQAQQIESLQASVDCGQVVFKHPVTATFRMRNPSPRALIINDVRTSCGCTTVTYPKTAIEGGEEFTVEASYDAMTMGHFVKFVSVYSNASESPLVVSMKGIVVDGIADYEGNYPFTLGELKVDKNDLEFDDVNRGDMPKIEIHIFNPTSEGVQPQIMHLPPYLKARVYPAEIAPGHSGVATITLDSKKLHDFGLTQTTLYLGAHPGEKVTPETEITVSSVLLPSFKMSEEEKANAPQVVLSADSFSLGSFKGRKKLKGQIEIGNKGLSPLVISSLQMFTGGLEVKLDKTTIPAGGKANLKVTAYADGLKGVRSKPRLLLITNDPGKSKIVLNVNVR